jgi:ATP-dependent DNA helicase RecG
MGLNERQSRAIRLLQEQGTLTNLRYQETFSVSKRTASNELRDLVKRDILARYGTTGKGTYYTLKDQQRGKTGNKGAAKGQNASLLDSEKT